MLSSLATSFMDTTILEPRNPPAPRKLRTIGLGAPTYADVMVGSNRSMSKLQEYRQLRIYLVDYRTNVQGEVRSVLDPIAKGTVDEAIGFGSRLELFKRYWLG